MQALRAAAAHTKGQHGNQGPSTADQLGLLVRGVGTGVNQDQSPRRDVLKMTNVPPDLLGIRAAADRVGRSIDTVRSYIDKGLGKRKLRTYRMPDDPNTVLVSLAELIRFASETSRVIRRTRYEDSPSNVVTNLHENEARALMFLRESIKRRLKVDVTYSAIVKMLILDAARAQGWSDKQGAEEQAKASDAEAEA